MDLETVVETRRSVRAYAGRPVPDDVLGRVLELTHLAPSAMNHQPWKFIVVKDQARRTEIARLSHDQSFMAEAPVIVVFCGRRYDNPHNWMGSNLFLIDVAIAVDHFTLAARDAGLGTCWIGAFDHEPLRALLEVPADHDIVMLVPVGYPASDTAFGPTTERLALADVVCHERFGGPTT